jgi:Helitron helicase-like domain at N-terminus
METYTYPLLFTRGEPGWGSNCKPEVQLNQYIMSRILQAEDILLPSLLDPAVNLRVNRLQAMARLGQVWMVDMVSRMYDFRLEWVKLNQSRIRGEDSGAAEVQDMEEADRDQRDAGSKNIYLPTSVTGGRRHLAEKAKEALAVVAEKGTATEFITLTVNYQWREIQEMLLQGQSAFDRPDIVCQVFREKVEVFMRNVRRGKYHGGNMRYTDRWNAAKQDWDEDTMGEFVPPARPDGETNILDYEMVVIEYQHRGLPHAHIVIRVKFAPEGIYRDDTVASAKRKEAATFSTSTRGVGKTERGCPRPLD